MESLIVIAVTIVAGLWTLYWVWNFIFGRKYNLPPSPPAWPIIGHDPLIVRYMKDLQQHEFFVWFTETYGPIVRLKRFNRQIYIVNDAASAKKILTTTDFARGPRLQEFTKGITDYALFVLPTGTLWHTHRKLLQPSFGPYHLKSSIKVTLNNCKMMEKQWKSQMESHDGKGCVDIYKQFQALTLDIIGEIAFSHQFNALDAFFTGTELSEGQRHWDRLLESVQRRFMYLPFLWGFYGLSPSSPGIVKMRSSLVRFLQKLIDKKRDDLCTKAVEERDDKAKDVLDRLLEAEGDDEKTLTDEEIQGEVVGFFLAGHETTANALTWAIYTLSQHPEIQERLAKEVQSVSTDVSIESVQNLEYLDWVVKEVLRLHPVVHLLARISVKETTLCGYDIPKDTPILLTIRAIHHNPKYWPDPLSFQPERWKQVPQPGTYLPFGDGQHVCIGMKLALLEIKVCLIYVISRFTFSLVPGQDLKTITSITSGLKGGCLVEFRSRS